MGLADDRCEVCRPGMPHLPDDEVLLLAGQLDPSWTVVGGHERIRRTVGTDDFAESMSVAVRIGLIAEAEGHHPDLTVSWGKLGIEIFTHAADGLTRNDFVLAAKIDRLVGPSA